MADPTPNSPQQGFFLAFVPRYDVAGTLHMFTLYLVNKLPEEVKYDFDLEMKKEWAEGFEGYVSPGDSIVITDLDFMKLADQPVINLRCHVRWQGKTEHFEKSIRPKPKNLLQLKHNDYFDAPAYQYELWMPKTSNSAPPVVKKPMAVDTDLLRMYMLENAPMSDKTSISTTHFEVDLHFEAIMKDDGTMSSGEKFHVQLNTFNRQLDLAIANGLHYMVFIHGVGTGKLKKELYSLLQKHPHVRSYGPCYSPQYGFGATEVFF
jgi:hypothetical protein